MRQHPIDLLPDSIRTRSHAGVVAGRYIASVIISVILLAITATHSRLMYDLATERLHAEEKKADIVLTAEAKAERLRRSRDDLRRFIDRYETIALPVEVSRVIATMINMLPESASIDRLDLYAGPRQNASTPRSRGGREPDGPQPRELVGEINGFAKTRGDVSEIVAALESLGLFDTVSLDFSRARTIRGEAAREFNISFRSNLEARYLVEDWAPTPRQETADVE